jgi:hypothetical protein
METNENLLNNDLQIDSTAFGYLQESAKWAKFLGIIGFIITVFIVLAAFFAGTIFSTVLTKSNPYSSYPSGGAGILGVVVTILYLIGGVITFFLSLFMFRFGSRTKSALLATDQASLNSGLNNLRLFLKMYGIIIIIYLGFMALALILSIAGAAFSGR